MIERETMRIGQEFKSPTAAKSKLEQLKQLVIETEQVQSCSKPISLQINTCQHAKCCSGGCSCGSNKLLQAPIILEKRTPRTAKHTTKTKFDFEVTAMGSPRGTTYQARATKQVEEFKPIEVPTRKSTLLAAEHVVVPPRTKEIEVRIEKDDKDRDCIKKLFKKINKLSDELAASERERAKLQL